MEVTKNLPCIESPLRAKLIEGRKAKSMWQEKHLQGSWKDTKEILYLTSLYSFCLDKNHLILI